ncbi:Uncharacterised protein [BD1-7 clade bacterium]|uniref:HmuY protein n=1 Tax=BD1-7 clade bacterium TaxID=2029982 RepID=A0A5S9MP33_9GAMM|nr:Uncharacterised protein [BD1-7 clade bacterium]
MIFDSNQKLPALLASASVAMLLAGCSDSDSSGSNGGDGDEPKPSALQTAVVDASSETAYFNLVDGNVVGENDTWHVSFNRYNVTLNDQAEGAIGDEQAEYYDDDGALIASFFVNADLADELNSLNAVSEAAGDFVGYGIKSAIDSSWYAGGRNGFAVVPENYWIIGSAEGNSYAKFHAASFTAAQSGADVTFEFFVQADGETTFSDTPLSTTVSMSGGSPTTTCYDFDDPSNSDCSSVGWDVKFQGFNIFVNGGVSSDGAAKAYNPETVDEVTNGAEVNPNAWQTDKESSIFTDFVWQEYQASGDPSDHSLYPNYRVYVIDTDKDSDEDELIKLQITSYYDPDTGASANVSFRYLPLTETTEE